jgi:hypothetical protein
VFGTSPSLVESWRNAVKPGSERSLGLTRQMLECIARPSSTERPECPHVEATARAFMQGRSAARDIHEINTDINRTILGPFLLHGPIFSHRSQACNETQSRSWHNGVASAEKGSNIAAFISDFSTIGTVTTRRLTGSHGRWG